MRRHFDFLLFAFVFLFFLLVCVFLLLAVRTLLLLPFRLLLTVHKILYCTYKGYIFAILLYSPFMFVVCMLLYVLLSILEEIKNIYLSIYLLYGKPSLSNDEYFLLFQTVHALIKASGRFR